MTMIGVFQPVQFHFIPAKNKYGHLSRVFRFIYLAPQQQITEKKYGGSVVTYDVGGAYLITDMIQADMAMSWGATDAAPDFSWTMGLSAKF